MMNENEKNFNSFIIKACEFLKQDIKAYHSLQYTNLHNPENPDWIVDFKDDNSKYGFDSDVIVKARNKGYGYVLNCLTHFCCEYKRNKENFVVCVVPRSKPYKSTHFKDFIQYVIGHIQERDYGGSIIDGTDYIKRIRETRTTHFSKSDGGLDPYPGITKDTCDIFEEGIKGRNVLLVDDIYTHHHGNKFVGVDEDCLQALLDCGAKRVEFYALAKTRQKD
nr:hypothetical protein [uncultured Helicobacter sp.]